MSASTLLTGTPAAVDITDVSFTDILCQNLQAASIECTGVINSTGNIDTTATVNAVSVLAEQATIGEAGAPSPLQVIGAVGQGVVYDSVNNKPVVSVVAGSGIAVDNTDPANPSVSISWEPPTEEELVATFTQNLAPNSSTPYTFPNTGWYVLNYTINNSKTTDGFAWVNGTNFAQLSCLNNGTPDTNTYATITSLTPCLAGLGVAGGDILEHTINLMVYGVDGQVLSAVTPSVGGGAVNLGNGGGLTVSIQPLA